VIIFLIFFGWTLGLTYPLILTPTRFIPQGSEGVGTVPFLNLWILQWNIDQAIQGYPHFWDTPIFFPSTGTFAFSEIQPLSALLAAPLWLGLQSPGLAYNGLIILFLTLNGWFVYWLLRLWRASHIAALLAGLLGQAIPFVAQEMGVLQLLAIFGFAWSLLYLHRFLHRPGWQHGLGLTLGLPLTFFTCSYYGFFSLLFLPLAFITLIPPSGLTLKILGQLLLTILLSLALTVPLLATQRDILATYNLSRSEPTIQNSSAQLRDYTHSLDYNLVYGHLLGRQFDQPQRLFPGFGLLFLAGIGFFWGPNERWWDGKDREKRRRLNTGSIESPPASPLKVYLLLALILAFILSLGLNVQLGHWRPYQTLRQILPGLEQLRSPFRFAALGQLHLVLLAGFGLDGIKRWARGRSGLSLCLSLLIAGLVLFESLALPLPLQALPAFNHALPWQTWLTGQTEIPQIALIPFAPSPRVADFEQTTRWMLANRTFSGKMVNGYSGFFPPGHGALREAMRDFPNLNSLDTLRDYQVEYVVVYHGLANAPPLILVEAQLPLVFYDIQNQAGVYRLAR